jgi:predicted MFS family arabinose efflux permease
MTHDMDVQRPTTAETPFPRRGLVVLAAAIFLSMSIEFLPGGLLPQISAEFGRSLGESGQLITIFAAAVILTTTPVGALTRNVPRKPLAVVAVTAIILASVATALSPTIEILMAARAIGGVAHGLFWTVAAAYAADLVPRDQLGKAIAITAAGGSVAGVLGVPLGNALGQLWGWRAAFAAAALVGALVVGAVVAWLPPVHGIPRLQSTDAGGAGAQLESTLPSILFVCGIILLVVIGQTTFGTYSVAWLESIASLPRPGIPIYLLVTGLAAALGVAVVAHFGDKYPRAAMGVSGAIILCALAGLALASGVGLLFVFAAGIALAISFGVLPTMLQARMMHVASARERGLAAALQATAFNVGIGGGALLGGVLLSWSGLSVLPWAALILTGAGLTVMIVGDSRRRRRH